MVKFQKLDEFILFRNRIMTEKRKGKEARHPMQKLMGVEQRILTTTILT